MIKIDKAIISLEEDKDIGPIDFSMDKGIKEIDEGDLSLWNILSFSFYEIKDGSIEIDGAKLSKDNNVGNLFLIDINSRDVCSLSAVFACLDEKANREYRNKISLSIKALKDLPRESLEEKKAKLTALLNTLVEDKTSYILFDSNQSINKTNKGFIATIMDSYKDKLCFIAQKEKIVLKKLVIKDDKIICD